MTEWTALALGCLAVAVIVLAWRVYGLEGAIWQAIDRLDPPDELDPDVAGLPEPGSLFEPQS